MPFIEQKFHIKDKIKLISFLQDTLNYTQKQAQKCVDKGRVKIKDKPFLDKSAFVCGDITISIFKEQDIGISPIFSTQDFAIFDKPEKILIHPKGRFYHHSLLDSIRFHLGKEANPINRLDSETSGILLVSKNKNSEIELKKMFEEKCIQKEYLAFVFGKINDCIINLKIKEQDKSKDLGVKSIISNDGRESITKIKLISYFENKNISFIKALPITGRTHQIRLHLSHIGHRILGECLYGISDCYARDYLDSKLNDDDRLALFGASRLMLHSQRLDFTYKNVRYILSSKIDFNINKV